jgi:HlyD family secretion protein
MIGWLRRNEWPLGWTSAILGLITASSYLAVTYGMDTWPWPDRRPLRERYMFHNVSRCDLAPILQAPGRLESARRTMVRCQLENLTGSRAGGMGSSSTLLETVPEGSIVKEGDVLARLDASNYEELLRQQIITVEQAKASYLQAQLNYDIAVLAVREYRDGTVQETLKGMEGQIALARSDLSRALDHLSWTKRMSDKGYSSVATIASEEHSVSQLQVSLQRQLTAMDLYQRFTLPKTEKTLEGQVKSTQTNLNNESLRLQRQLDRLALLKSQVERCIIRAPHDGMLFYYKDSNPRGGRTSIEEGMTVRQRQILYYLPDLSEMEAQVILNESIVDRVAPGLGAKVRFEALPGVVVDGRVASIGQIPGGQSNDGEDIRYFIALVKLNAGVPGLKPNMSTRVDIALPLRKHVVAVPHQVLRLDGSKRICFVAQGESLERREVTVGQGTTDLIEITDGLEEGDQVALDPPGVLGPVSPLLEFDDIELGAPSQTGAVTASHN